MATGEQTGKLIVSAEQFAKLSSGGEQRGRLSLRAEQSGSLSSGAEHCGKLSTGGSLAAKLLARGELTGKLSGTIRYIEIPGGRRSHIIVRSGKASFVELPAEGFYGIGSVTVEGDEDLVPGNIRSGVNILGVDGDYSPSDARLVAKNLTISANGKYTVTPGSGYDGMSRVVVTADVPQEVVKVDAITQTKTVTPGTKNQDIRPDEDYDALSSVLVYGDADLVPGNIRGGVSIFGVVGTYEKRELQSKNITPGKNAKTVVADKEYDGLSSVHVAGDSDLIPANIREGVNLFGVVGSYSTGQNFQSKSVTPGRLSQTVTADEDYNALSSVTVRGDSNLVPGKIADGESVFGVTGNYVSPMKPITVVPSKDEQYIIPAAGFYGFSAITVAPADVTGEYTEGFRDGAASRDDEVAALEERINSLTGEKNAAYDEGYSAGYADGAIEAAPGYIDLDEVKF